VEPLLARELEDLHAASWGWALACCARNRDDASEALQQAYCKVLSGQARFDRRSSLRTFLFGVIRLCAREQRRWWRLDRLLALGHGPSSEAPAPDADVDAQREGAHLAAALAGLAARQREVLHLVFYEGLSVSEAAEVMGVSLGSARQHYDRGKKNLAGALRARGVER
jgi:RNA polymerase sigma-70 factor (ECF subfamily)